MIKSPMVRFLRALGIAALILLAAALFATAALLAFGDPLAHAVVTVDDHSVTLGDLQGNLPLFALVALVVLMVLLFVVPLAVALPLLFAVLVVATVLMAIVGTLALFFSPLILLGWLAWRLVRPARPPWTERASGVVS
jgi:hypothetical protein